MIELKTSTDEIINKIINLNGFKEKLDDSKKQNLLKEPTQYYAFLSEIKVANFFTSNNFNISFIKESKDPPPDFECDLGNNKKLYIEVNLPTKQFVKIRRLENNINKEIMQKGHLKYYKFYFSNYHFHIISNFDNDFKEIYNSCKNKIDELNCIQNDSIEIYSNEYLKGIISKVGYRINGNGKCTVNKLLDESQKNKWDNGKNILKNNLNNCHPNILWSDFLFLEDFHRLPV